MTEPRIEQDVDIAFSSGERLFVGGLQPGHDTITTAAGELVIERTDPGSSEVIRIALAKVDCWRLITRTLAPEPTDAAGNTLEI